MSATGDSVSGGRRGEEGPVLRLFGRLVAWLEVSGKVIAALCLAFMFAALLVNVVLRYLFGSGIAWAYEIHALLLPWLVAGGIVIAAARGRHIAITLLADAVEGRTRLALLLFVQVAIVAISIGVLWSGQPILRASRFQTLSTLGVKQIWGYSSLVYAFAGTAFIAAYEACRTLRGVDVLDHDPRHASLS